MSLEVPDPPAPIPPKPLVFERSREFQFRQFKMGGSTRYLVVAFAFQAIMVFRRPFANYAFPNHKNSVYLALIVLWAIGSMAFLFALVKTARKRGRIEIVGPAIYDYDQDNNVRAKEELKSIVALWEKFDPDDSSERIYLLQFANGTIMSFPSASEKALKLKTIVEQWSKQKFEHLSLATDETRALIQSSSSS